MESTARIIFFIFLCGSFQKGKMYYLLNYRMEQNKKLEIKYCSNQFFFFRIVHESAFNGFGMAIDKRASKNTFYRF